MWLVVVNVGSALQKKDPLEISQKFLPHWEIFFLKPKKKSANVVREMMV